MQRIYDSGNREMSLNVTIITSGKKNFRIWAEDLGKVNSKYSDRIIEVDGRRTIHINFPVSPKEIFIGCLNANNPNDKDFEIILQEAPLRKYDIYEDADVKEFVQLAINFSQVCGFRKPAPQGTIYESKTGKFKIKLLPQITAPNGQVINTPARIGHKTGIIEISADKFARYTIPMRVCILLHEFSHKYKNPKIGLEVSNEFGADINGLYIYLGIGFSKIDAICVFSRVFLRAQSSGNMQRIRKIQDYIKRFENQEYAQALN